LPPAAQIRRRTHIDFLLVHALCSRFSNLVFSYFLDIVRSSSLCFVFAAFHFRLVTFLVMFLASCYDASHYDLAWGMVLFRTVTEICFEGAVV